MVDQFSVRQVEQAVRRRVIELDTAAVVRRAAKARADRYVCIRPAPDCVTQLSALLPVEQGVAVYASLRREAVTRRAGGDARSKAQIMADTLVQRSTGQTSADRVPVEIALVMTSDALLGHTETPAQIPGHGPIPARLARQIATNAFSGALAMFIRLRDQNCRDPYCDAPIRDLDHLHPYAHGGPTSTSNGQGLCQRGNLTRELPGWTTTGTGTHRVTRTPTGHTYTSRPPPALGPMLVPSTTPRARSA